MAFASSGTMTVNAAVWWLEAGTLWFLCFCTDDPFRGTFNRILLSVVLLSLSSRCAGFLIIGDEDEVALSSARKQPSSGSVTPTRAFFPPDDVKATETAAVRGYMTPSPGSKGSYKYTDRKFMTVHFYHDEDLNSDVMTCTSRPNVPMADDTVEEILADVHDVLRMSRKSHIHIPTIYDIRKYQLPDAKGSFARARQLVAWMNSTGDMLSEHVCTVAVVIPSGFSAMLLKKVVEFIIYLVKPPMDPRIFEDDMEKARNFVKKRVRMYEERQLALQKPFGKNCRYDKPPDASVTDAIPFLQTGHDEPFCRGGVWDPKAIRDFYATQ